MGAPGTDLQGWRWVRGRSGRIEYWIWTLILLFVGYRATTLLAPIVPLIATILWIAVLVRRLHDVGLTGWWVAGLLFGQLVVYAIAATLGGEAAGEALASLAALVAQVILGFAPGQKAANRFGPAPARKFGSADAAS